MVRHMKCPYCGADVSVSSHWTNATCQKCHNNFEVGVEIFELSEEEQKKEMEIATQKVHEQEKIREERAVETKRRLREMMHIPEPDPHANIKFEEDEDEKAKQESKDGDKKKKLMIICGIAGVILLFVIIFVIMIVSAMNKSSETAATAETQPTPISTMQTETESDENTEAVEVTEEEHDVGWTDGFSIDSNSSDGKYMIDKQSSTTGEQKAVIKEPAVAEPSPDETSTENNVSENAAPATTADDVYPGAGVPAVQDTETAAPGNTAVPDGDSSVTSDDVISALFNG